MKITAVAIIVAILVCTVDCRAQKHRSLREILDAIQQVEGSGQLNPPDGDGGKAIGPYQIWRIYWKDTGIHGSYQLCRNKAYAEKTVLTYWRIHCPRALASLDYETLARTHNGGPDGMNNPKTVKYWRKVEKALHRRK